MKLLSLLVASALIFTANAQSNSSRMQNELEAKRLSIQMRTLVENNVDRLDDRELNQVLRNLERAKDLLLGRVSPPPAPNPIPVPQPRRVCEFAPVEIYQATFMQIKNFAYSSSGLDLSSQAATAFATEWMQRYSCEDANRFISLFGRLKNFAYSSSGLDMSSAEALNYSKNGINRLCEGFAFEAEYKNLYNFAYSTGGLDLSTTAAREYARARVEPQMFSCSPFGF